jgi:translation initiation factor IF-3
MEDTAINKFNTTKEEFIINEKIKFPELRVLDDKGNMLGVLKTEEARKLANEKELDLIVITEKANPPVARIIDYGKFIYEKEKQKKETKKKQKVVQLKEVKLRSKIGIHDLDIKIKCVKKFLENKDKVKITMSFFGREKEHSELGGNIMKKVMEAIKDESDIEKQPNMIGNSMILVVTPKK